MNEVGSVSIPDEAWRAVYGTDSLADAVEVAAPYIDRAARIDELKRIKGRFDDYAEHHEWDQYTMLSAESASRWIGERIAELEAQQ